MKTILKLSLFFFFSLFSGQRIVMEFPYFAGKSYDFILFQGSNSKTVHQGIIPTDGKFVLTIPPEYAPYKGMCRWLITGTEEGGGLDMVIPGKDFSVVCKSEKPDNNNITYSGNDEMEKMNYYSQKQQEIFMRHDVMLQATKVFSKSDRNYGVFHQEYNNQLRAYDRFQVRLKEDQSYAAEFLRIVNITLGIGNKLGEIEKKRAESTANYIADELNWDVLYTSGHWAGVVSSWIDIHLQVLKDDKKMVRDFAKIGSKINKTSQYTDFADRVAYLLTQQGKDELIAAIAPDVLSSRKIASYEGNLLVYKRSGVGSVAPDIVLVGVKPGEKETRKVTMDNLLGKDYKKVLLVFYNSDCGICGKILEELSANYQNLLKRNVHVIGLSSDKDPSLCRNLSTAFPGNESYCDYQGLEGLNFRNYGVTGTPTLVLIDESGKIQLIGSKLSEVMSVLK